MYIVQGQVRLIKTHLPLSLLPPEMLNKCRYSYIFCLFDWTLWSGPRLPLGSLKTLNFNFLFTAVTLDSDFNNSFIALWSGLCTLGGTQRTWQCPITTTTGSPSVAICYLSLQLVFAICLCYLSLQLVFAICFYNLLFVC